MTSTILKIVPVLGLFAGCISVYLHIKNDNNSRTNFQKIEAQIQELSSEKKSISKKTNKNVKT